MIIVKRLTVNPGVTQDNPDEYEIAVVKGRLTELVILPAIGPNWEVFTRVLHLENAIIPDDNSTWIGLEREKLTFYPGYTDWNNVYNLKIQLCSPQANYQHTVQFVITISEDLSVVDALVNLINLGFRK